MVLITADMIGKTIEEAIEMMAEIEPEECPCCAAEKIVGKRMTLAEFEVYKTAEEKVI